MRDSMIFYRSFYEAIKELPEQNQLEVYNSIFEFGLNFTDIKLTGLSKTIFTLIEPQLKANIKRFENGNKPKSKQQKSKSEAKHKQNISKSEANNNVNVNDNVNVNNNNNKIYKSFDHLKISIDEFNNLQELGYSKSQIDNIISNIENYKANKKYKSLYLTALNWLKKEYPEAIELKEKKYSYKIHFTTFRNKSEKQYKEDFKKYGKDLILI